MEEKSEDKVTVEQLPAEMLLHVFSFLNTGDLKRSALVCKKLFEILGKSILLFTFLLFSIQDGMESSLRMVQL